MLRFILILISIDSINALNYQEDFDTSNYSHLACLQLKTDRKFLISNLHEDHLSSYQTFISSSMTVDLCFRLCRRWIVLLNFNQSTCLCLHTISRPYELRKKLGEIRYNRNCSNDELHIYSLKNSFYFLSTPTSAEDWTLDGCYYMHGIQTVGPNLLLNDANYSQAIEICQKHCQILRTTNQFSFFLSLKKSCYCLPIHSLSNISPLVVRKPLIHCSFIPTIGSTFDDRLNLTGIHSETVIKIDVQQYCSPTFTFDRDSYLCSKLVALGSHTNYSQLIDGEPCLPLLIQTYEKWNSFISYPFPSAEKTYVRIDRNSTYVFESLFTNKTNEFSLLELDYCLVIDRTNPNDSNSFDLSPCSMMLPPGFTLCLENPIETLIDGQTDLSQNTAQIPTNSIEYWNCPPDFHLFDGVCYFVDSVFESNITLAEERCFNQSINSTLVRFQSHEWSNIDGNRFLGRKQDDILLEFFYYLLETKLSSILGTSTRKKHWLRLLLGTQSDLQECTLRYFTRSSGAFTTVHRCLHSGHPVCQTQPNLVEPFIHEYGQNSMNTSVANDILIDPFTPSISVVDSNETIDTNRTVIDVLPADEDLPKNDTDTEFNGSDDDRNLISSNTTEKYRNILIMITGPVLALLLLCIGLFLMIYYSRSSHGSYSPRRSASFGAARHRHKTASMMNIVSDENFATPSVLYTRLKSVAGEPDAMGSTETSMETDDSIQLLPRIFLSNTFHETTIKENEDEEPLCPPLNESHFHSQ